MRNSKTNVDTIVKFVEEHWHEGLTIKEMAKELNMHPTNLERVMHKAKGMPLKQYENNLREQKLFQLISDDHRCGYKICYTLGFNDEGTFYHWVKRRFGKTVTELRLQVRQNIGTSKLNNERGKNNTKK